MSAVIPFDKMQGIGNDFIMLDALRDTLPGDLTALAQWTNDRPFGIGGDGIIILDRGADAPFRMRMLNPDGSESEMCGNGIRCIAKMIRSHGHSSDSLLPIETGAGLLQLELLEDGRVRVDMGLARTNRESIGMTDPSEAKFIDQPVWDDLRGTAVSMGNPHLVVFVDDVAVVPLTEGGPILEHHSEFPQRTNVHFVQVVNRQHLIQRTWERGAGVTLACGTGACSVAVAGVLTGRSERNVTIDLPGGSLEIAYREDERVFMTGPATLSYSGEFAWPRP